MKEGLGQETLSPYEVAAIRILSAGVVLLPFVVRSMKQMNARQRLYSIITGLLGSFLPAFLFCLAETKVDSAVAGMLNALTPLFVAFLGALFFGVVLTLRKIAGVLTGFAGMVLLCLHQPLSWEKGHWGYLSLILLATVCYGFNVNIANRHLKSVPPLAIACIAFTFLIPASVLILWWHDFFTLPFADTKILWSISASAILGLTGTALATILFYMLMKKAGPLFSSMVTYGIPFVAIGWGMADGEKISLYQVGSLLVILGGVYLANKQEVTVQDIDDSEPIKHS